MKYIHHEGKVYGLSTLEMGRHWVCMSCRDTSRPTITPLEEHEDGDHEPDGDSLCLQCSLRVLLEKPGLSRWIDLTEDQTEKLWEKTAPQREPGCLPEAAECPPKGE